VQDIAGSESVCLYSNDKARDNCLDTTNSMLAYCALHGRRPHIIPALMETPQHQRRRRRHHPGIAAAESPGNAMGEKMVLEVNIAAEGEKSFDSGHRRLRPVRPLRFAPCCGNALTLCFLCFRPYFARHRVAMLPLLNLSPPTALASPSAFVVVS
jgi:hypothetical protein